MDLFRNFFQNILSQCVEAGLVAGEVVHLDSSLIGTNASVDSLQPAFAVLAEQMGRQRATMEGSFADATRHGFKRAR